MFVVRNFIRNPETTERQHTRYDEELGWINIPGTRIEDLYGAGRTLTINKQGFRARREYSTDETSQHPANHLLR